MRIKILGPQSALGLAVAGLTLFADQVHKSWMIDVWRLGERGTVELAPFFDLVLVWNRGVSYGLLKQNSGTGAWLLAIFACLTAIGIALWLAQLPSRVTATSAGLIMGGALGNAIDRMRFGAVADYFSFHIGQWHWYVFNIADGAIVVGVAGLLYDWLKSSHKTAGNEV